MTQWIVTILEAIELWFALWEGRREFIYSKHLSNEASTAVTLVAANSCFDWRNLRGAMSCSQHRLLGEVFLWWLHFEQHEQSDGTFTLPHLNFWGASMLFVRDVDWTTCPPGDSEASKQTVNETFWGLSVERCIFLARGIGLDCLPGPSSAELMLRFCLSFENQLQHYKSATLWGLLQVESTSMMFEANWVYSSWVDHLKYTTCGKMTVISICWTVWACSRDSPPFFGGFSAA